MNPATAGWFKYLEQMDAPDVGIELPSRDALPSVLLDLAVPHEDIDPLIALLPAVQQADVWWMVERAAQSIIQHTGQIDGPHSFPQLPEEWGALGRYFFVYVYVSVLPHTRAFHEERAIDTTISRQTLTDLGRNMAVHRFRYNAGGLHAPNWTMHHFTGNLYALGRLQFERSRLGNRTGEAVARAGLQYGPGDPALSVHIPAFFGSLSPEACDASFGRAKDFFDRHFPDEPHDVVLCHSWLLDEQLANYLPTESNIVRFQRRFTSAYTPEASDETIIQFVFGKTEAELNELPQRTRLERVVVEHIKAGHHWHGGAGWTRLP